MRKWNLFTFWVFVAFGVLSVIAAVAGFVLMFMTPMYGVIVLAFAVVLGVLSFWLKRSFDTMTREDG